MTLPVRTQRPRPAARAATALLSWMLVCMTTGAGLPGTAAATAPGGPAPGSPPAAGAASETGPTPRGNPGPGGPAGAASNKPPAPVVPAVPTAPPPAAAPEPMDDPAPSPGTFRNMVPSAWLETQGAQTYAQVLGAATRARRLEPAGNARVVQAREILQRLVPYALKWNDRARGWKWEVNLVRSRDINAFCLPGGKIVINTGMLERLKLNDDETALLMSHLVAHALREHARSRIDEEQTAPPAAGVPSARPGAVVGRWSAADIAAQLIAMRYGPSDETEADVIGADIASRAGFDPRAGLVLWQKVDWIGRRRRLPFTLAHPVSAKRLTDLKKRQRDMLPLYAKAKNTTVGRLPPYRPGR